MQSQDLDQLEIKSINHIHVEEDAIVSSYANMTIESINLLLVLYKKAVNSNSLQDKEKCNLNLIISQIERLSEQGALQMDKEQVIAIFTMLSTKVENDENSYVQNHDLQQYISKFENYLLLNKYGQSYVENYEQAYVFHESEEEETNSDESSKDDIIEETQEQVEKVSPTLKKKCSLEYANFLENSPTLSCRNSPSSPKSLLLNYNDNTSMQLVEKRQSNVYIENVIATSMRELYPLLSDLLNKDESSKHVVDKIEVLYNSLQQEIANLQSSLEERDSQVQMLNEQTHSKSQIMNQMEKKIEEYTNMNHSLEERLQRQQEYINKMTTKIKAFEEEKENEVYSLQQEIDKLSKKTKDCDSTILELKLVISEQKKTIEEVQSTVSVQEKDLEKLRSRSFESSQKLLSNSLVEQQKQSNEHLQSALSYLEEENEHLREENEKLQKQLSSYIKIIEEKEESNDYLNKEISTLKKLVNEFNDSNSQSDIQFSSKDFLKNVDSLKERQSLKVSLQNSKIEYEQFVPDEKMRMEHVSSIQEDVERFQKEEMLSRQQEIENNALIPKIHLESCQEVSQDSRSLDFSNSMLSSKLSQLKLELKTGFYEQIEHSPRFLDLFSSSKRDSGTLKPINCFSFAALEIIQTSRAIQSRRDLQDSEHQLQSQQRLSNPSAFRNTDQQNYFEQEENAKQYDESNFSPKRHLQTLQQRNPLSLTIPERDNGSTAIYHPRNFNNLKRNSVEGEQNDNKIPSFQQVLKGDADFYWNQLGKNFVSGSSNSITKTHLIDHQYGYGHGRQQQFLNAVQEFSVVQETGTPHAESKGRNLRILKKKYSFTTEYQNILVSSDYLNLKEDSRILNIRKQYENSVKSKSNKAIVDDLTPKTFVQSLSYFYSDSIYRINAQNEKERRILCITQQFVYIINPMENFKIVRKFKVRLINRITFSNTNSNLCVIHVMNQSDYVIESCRRFELNLFLNNLFKVYLRLPIYMISFAENLLIRSKKKSHGKIFDRNQLSSRVTQNSFMAESDHKGCEAVLENKTQQFYQNNNNSSNNYLGLIGQYGEFSNQLNMIDIGKDLSNIYHETPVINIYLKSHLNIIKSLFTNPWKPLFLKAVDTSVSMFKDSDCEVKEAEFTVKNLLVQEHLQGKEKLEAYEMKMIDSKDNIVYIKTYNLVDYNLLIEHFKMLLQN